MITLDRLIPGWCFRLSAVCGLACVCTGADGAEVAVDFNDQAASVLRNQEVGGSGLTGTWFINTSSLRVGDGDLTVPESIGYSVVQTSPAQHVYDADSANDRRQAALLAEPLTGEIWFSFLAQNNGATEVCGIDFYNPESTASAAPRDPYVLLVGQTLDISGAGTVDLSSAISLGETVLVVGRLTVGESETIQVWINPTLTTKAALLASSADLEETADLGWNLDSIGVLGLEIYNTADTGTGGLLDAVRLSNEKDGLEFVTGLPSVTLSLSVLH